LRADLRVLAVPLRHVVPLRQAGEGLTLSVMEARALAQTRITDRARFVRLTRERVASEADAEDVVQRALMRATERAQSLEDPARARGWFYRILRNAIADHHRAGRSERAKRADGLEPEELADESAESPRTPCTCSLRLLAELRPAYAEVLRRVEVDGEDPADVARALGISAGNLHVRLHRARRALRDDVQHYCGVETHEPCLDCECGGEHRCGSETS
jgi:RNA polymerase sigma-70 factor (ECF subfamily)